MLTQLNLKVVETTDQLYNPVIIIGKLNSENLPKTAMSGIFIATDETFNTNPTAARTVVNGLEQNQMNTDRAPCHN